MATRSPPGSPPAQPLAGYSSPNNFTTVSPPGPTPYPDAAYPAQPVITDQAPQTIVVVTPPPINPNPVFRYRPMVVRCQFCHIDVLTMVYPKVGCFTWVACLFISFCGSLTAILAFWFFSFNMGCCLIPFCVDECQDAIHVCPNCRREIARYSRL